MNKPSIMIVDDEPLNLKLSAESLSPHYTVHLARNGKDALMYLEHNRVDIVLLDIIMPEMDGFETAAKIHNLPNNVQTPIIYLTSDDSDETIEKAFSAGAVDYLSKPFRKKELLVRIKNHIQTEKLKRALKSAKEHNEHLLEIVEQHVSFVKTDTDGTITKASLSFCDMFHATQSELIGKNMNILKSGHTPKDAYDILWKTIKNGNVYIHEIEDKNFYGNNHWFKVMIAPDSDKDGHNAGYVAFYTNVDEKIKYKHDAYTDHLTGLNNRAQFDQEIKKEIYNAIRYQKHFSIILADIDHFKEVNDCFGHDVGDSVLKEFASLLAQNIRQSDFIARWGGEEFIILCPNTNIENAVIIAEKLRSIVDRFAFGIVGHKTASFGVTENDQEGDEKKLFLKVDEALYRAKEGGRNQVCY